MDKRLEELIIAFSNAAFSCGAHDDSEMSMEESFSTYNELLEENKRAHQALIDYIEDLKK